MILLTDINKAFSSDASKLIEQHNTLLKQQKMLILQQMRGELSKKKVDNNTV